MTCAQATQSINICRRKRARIRVDLPTRLSQILDPPRDESAPEPYLPYYTEWRWDRTIDPQEEN